jgi:2,4-dienoyl-CoA reductase-like NADH-dependent reductase (Old Yellow Enzyme family)
MIFKVSTAVRFPISSNETTTVSVPPEMSRGAENDTYKYFIKTLAERHPKLAYLHVIESRVLGGRDRDLAPEKEMNNDEFFALWSPRPYISTGGHTRESGIKVAEKHDNVLVAYARQFLANVGFHPTTSSLFVHP